MLATGATSCDFISFDPRIENEAFRMCIINVPADVEMQQELVERLAMAKDYLDQISESMKITLSHERISNVRHDCVHAILARMWHRFHNH
jgi:hypothetical protein